MKGKLEEKNHAVRLRFGGEFESCHPTERSGHPERPLYHSHAKRPGRRLWGDKHGTRRESGLHLRPRTSSPLSELRPEGIRRPKLPPAVSSDTRFLNAQLFPRSTVKCEVKPVSSTAVLTRGDRLSSVHM